MISVMGYGIQGQGQENNASRNRKSNVGGNLGAANHNVEGVGYRY